MTGNRNSDGTVEALKNVLDAMIDPINQLFFHSRMLRSRGHSLGMTRNMEWIAKMRRTGALALALHRHGAVPNSRDARDLEIGNDPASILASDARQTRWFIRIAEKAVSACNNEQDRALLESIVMVERDDLAKLEGWKSGPEAHEETRHAKFLLPGPGGTKTAIDALNTMLPGMTASVSQVFHHSLIFKGTGNAALAERELNLALVMMYRSEALLERLLDLRGTPDGRAHGRLIIGEGERAADEATLTMFDTLIPALAAAREPIDGIVDPTTHTLLDGIGRALRDDRAIVAARLAG